MQTNKQQHNGGRPQSVYTYSRKTHMAVAGSQVRPPVPSVRVCDLQAQHKEPQFGLWMILKGVKEAQALAFGLCSRNIGYISDTYTKTLVVNTTQNGVVYRSWPSKRHQNFVINCCPSFFWVCGSPVLNWAASFAWLVHKILQNLLLVGFQTFRIV